MTTSHCKVIINIHLITYTYTYYIIQNNIQYVTYLLIYLFTYLIYNYYIHYKKIVTSTSLTCKTCTNIFTLYFVTLNNEWNHSHSLNIYIYNVD